MISLSRDLMNKARNIHRLVLVLDRDFNLTTDELELVEFYITTMCFDCLKEFYNNKAKNKYQRMNAIMVRRIARDRGIYNWNIKAKDTLVGELYEQDRACGIDPRSAPENESGSIKDWNISREAGEGSTESSDHEDASVAATETLSRSDGGIS